jgi:hypothetical protein
VTKEELTARLDQEKTREKDCAAFKKEAK